MEKLTQNNIKIPWLMMRARIIIRLLPLKAIGKRNQKNKKMKIKKMIFDLMKNKINL